MIFVVVDIKKGNHTKNDDDGDTRQGEREKENCLKFKREMPQSGIIM